MLTPFNSGGFALFNPFTETPIQGTHWEFGPQFGEAVDRFAYEPPRMFQFNVGVHF